MAGVCASCMIVLMFGALHFTTVGANATTSPIWDITGSTAELLNATAADNNATESSTTVAADGNATESSTTIAVSVVTTEHMLNISSAYDSYWVKTVIEVRDADVTSAVFARTMEYRLATVYSLAMTGGAGMQTSRQKRATTYLNATIQMTNVTHQASSTVNTELIYFLVQYDANGNMTTAAETCALMNRVSTQQVAIMLGYVVVIQCQLYIPVPAPPPSYLWVIGAVIGGLIGLLLLLWCIMYTYFQCNRSQRYAKHNRQLGPMSTDNSHLPDIIPDVKDSEDACVITEPQPEFSDNASAAADSSVDATAIKIRRIKKTRRNAKSVVDRQTSTDFNAEIQTSEYDKEALDSNRIVQDTEAAVAMEMSLSASCKPVAVHTPLYIATSQLLAARPTVPPWDPYVAGDMAAAIFQQAGAADWNSPVDGIIDPTPLNRSDAEAKSDVDTTANNDFAISPHTVNASYSNPNNATYAGPRVAWSHDSILDQSDDDLLDGRRLRELDREKLAQLVRREFELLQATPSGVK